MQLRTMSEQDIPAGMRLKEIAGWNQTASDWKSFLKASPAGCFVAEVDGIVRGTAATISYEHKFAWVGMVLVDPEFRGQGIGTRLLEKTIAYLDATKIPAIKLDATPQGRPIYEKLGFTPEYEIARLILKRPPKIPDALAVSESVSVDSNQLRAIVAADEEIFGASRSDLLCSLHQNAPDLTVAEWRNGNLHGYAFGRHGSFADQQGPWMAMDSQAARRLLETFLRRCSGETLVVDCLQANQMARELVRAHGFSYSRSLTRMYRGENQFPGKTSDLCAILGPEFG
jgi:GNAT superfamily N-acetyltransferase